MKILITGAYGQLGNELRHCLEAMTAEIGLIPSEYEGAEVISVDRDQLDITDFVAVQDFMNEGEFDLIINSAAFTNVDDCEANENAAFAVNSTGPENLAKSANRLGAKLVHVSTDYVFPGNEPGNRIESDPTGPISAYGRTKLAGEHAVQANCKESFIVRTAWLYGYVGKNFVKTMRRLGETHDSITVVDDQLGNPTSANDLAYEILKLALTDDYGIYHCTNKGSCSWADFAKAIMEGSGLNCKVIPVTTQQYKKANPQSADRPAFSSLSNKHLADTIGDEMRDWQVALDEYLHRLPELEG